MFHHKTCIRWWSRYALQGTRTEINIQQTHNVRMRRRDHPNDFSAQRCLAMTRRQKSFNTHYFDGNHSAETAIVSTQHVTKTSMTDLGEVRQVTTLVQRGKRFDTGFPNH